MASAIALQSGDAIGIAVDALPGDEESAIPGDEQSACHDGWKGKGREGEVQSESYELEAHSGVKPQQDLIEGDHENR